MFAVLVLNNLAYCQDKWAADFCRAPSSLPPSSFRSASQHYRYDISGKGLYSDHNFI